VPGELEARRVTIREALGQTERQQGRLLDAYVAGVVELPAFEHMRDELTCRQETLRAQQRQVAASMRQCLNLAAVGDSLTVFCTQVRAGLGTATFEQRRALVELL
jgi:hypothetical protein